MKRISSEEFDKSNFKLKEIVVLGSIWFESGVRKRRRYTIAYFHEELMI